MWKDLFYIIFRLEAQTELIWMDFGLPLIISQIIFHLIKILTRFDFKNKLYKMLTRISFAYLVIYSFNLLMKYYLDFVYLLLIIIVISFLNKIKSY